MKTLTPDLSRMSGCGSIETVMEVAIPPENIVRKFDMDQTREKQIYPLWKAPSDQVSTDQSEAVGHCVHVHSGAVRRKRMQITEQDG